MADNITQEDVIDLSGEMKSRRDKLSKLVAEVKNPYQITKYSPDTSALKIIEAFDEYENKEVCVAGRMVGKRIMGKASFAHIMDDTAKIQLYVQVNALGADEYASFKTLDVGDIVGVKGTVFKTHSGEVSVRASEVVLLSK